MKSKSSPPSATTITVTLDLDEMVEALYCLTCLSLFIVGHVGLCPDLSCKFVLVLLEDRQCTDPFDSMVAKHLLLATCSCASASASVCEQTIEKLTYESASVYIKVCIQIKY